MSLAYKLTGRGRELDGRVKQNMGQMVFEADLI